MEVISNLRPTKILGEGSTRRFSTLTFVRTFGLFTRAFFEVICALAIVGTAVALFPVVKRQNEGIALGYVGLHTLETGMALYRGSSPCWDWSEAHWSSHRGPP